MSSQTKVQVVAAVSVEASPLASLVAAAALVLALVAAAEVDEALTLAEAEALEDEEVALASIVSPPPPGPPTQPVRARTRRSVQPEDVFVREITIVSKLTNKTHKRQAQFEDARGIARSIAGIKAASSSDPRGLALVSGRRPMSIWVVDRPGDLLTPAIEMS